MDKISLKGNVVNWVFIKQKSWAFFIKGLELFPWNAQKHIGFATDFITMGKSVGSIICGTKLRLFDSNLGLV